MTITKIIGIATISALAAAPALAKGHLPPQSNPPEYADFVSAFAGARAADAEKGASDKAKELKGLGNSKDAVIPGGDAE